MTIGDGRTAMFWEDRWLAGYRIQELAPAIYGRISKRARQSRTVADALTDATWARDIGPDMDEHALAQFLGLWPQVASVTLLDHTPDKLTWSWEKDRVFSARSAYAAGFASLQASPTAAFTWSSHAPLGFRFFAWLALQNWVWTSNRLARRGLPHQERCPFCDQDAETINHLLIRCVFAREIWDAVC